MSSPPQEPPRGILRNAPPKGTYDHLNVNDAFDRAQVMRNTKQNAELHKLGQTVLNDTSNLTDEERKDLKWNEADLYKNEQERTATMKIDEPKTPFQGPAGSYEYYADDEDKPRDDDIEGFSLGEPEVSVDEDDTVQNDRIIKSDSESEKEEEDDQDKQESAEDEAEAKHRRFEELRKAHYNMKGNVLKQPMLPVEEDDE